MGNNPTNSNDPSGHICVGEPDGCLKDDGTTGTGFTGTGGGSYGNDGTRDGRESGDEGEEIIDNPPAHPDPNLTIPPLGGSQCPMEYSLVQCAYSGSYYNPYGDIVFTVNNVGEFNELLLALFFDIKHRAPVGGYDFTHRSIYDTPLWDGYGPFKGKVCFESDCYKRSEVNYVAQGMWVAASDQSKFEGQEGVIGWKICSLVDICRRDPFTKYSPLPSEGTSYWLNIGYDTYKTLNNSYPYPLR